MRIHKHRRFQTPKFAPQEYKANKHIVAPEVRVIDEEGNALGVLPTEKAIAIAEEKGLDLIEEVEIKGIRLSLRIGEGDLMIRVNQGVKFFEQGDKIKVEMILRGRERAHFALAQGVFDTYIAKLGEHYPVKVESPVKAQGGKLHMIIARQT